MSRVHLFYKEPPNFAHPNDGWRSSADCLEDRTSAKRLLDATNLLSGRSATVRRTWHIVDCPGGDCGVQR
ncbi:hypothetical protein V1227_16920 [Lentzea sp. DG1S-22]|uniref:hypothetical protein n=1 Tax=Lentzea sp. DG1S-22 TaxID=3108822 RepID=UPI002E77F7ED|nr:hypothetical protein [Lentzea sp. DG1S-22]WVH84353.1 hypothetical protein V1227_16920 [Lentzea sp. DG1S-22]